MSSQKTFKEIVGITKDLRKKCPWDREQTCESLKNDLIEETYEVVNAVDRDGNLVEELGDLLHIIIMYAEISDAFDITDVLLTLKDKLIRRHPHVFGNKKAETPEQAKRIWDEVKKSEISHPAPRWCGAGPKSENSALKIAKDIQRKARDIGFDWKTIDGVFEKVTEEIKELIEAERKNEKEEELGDLLFTVSHLANFLDIDAEESLRKTCLKFEKRFKKIEKAVKGGDALSFRQMDRIWEGIKSEGI